MTLILKLDPARTQPMNRSRFHESQKGMIGVGSQKLESHAHRGMFPIDRNRVDFQPRAKQSDRNPPGNTKAAKKRSSKIAKARHNTNTLSTTKEKAANESITTAYKTSPQHHPWTESQLPAALAKLHEINLSIYTSFGKLVRL
ncbi:glutamic acid-rich protein precursor [Corchorus capsularis]|uniref:Glutamic acid-rich protein n=1 Tax=Corchorus capsularis TaxID=210143 RepID=A0A1R3GBN8_COCAP|nr:glutamic acid-rich protein precursor [Corchorus capsularis]